MQFIDWLAWLYWDPAREAFTVPFLDRPVMWYGILFVTGFILGYLLINPILTRFLNQIRRLAAPDILDRPHFIHVLRTSPSPIVTQLDSFLDPTTREQLKQHTPFKCTPEIQKQILEGLNRFLSDSSVSREELQQIFGKSLASTKQTAYFLADRLCWFVVTGTVVGARLGAVFFYDWPYFRQHPLEIFQIWHGGLASHGGVVGVMLSLYLYQRYIRKWYPELTFLRLLDYAAIPSALTACFIRLGNFMNQEILGSPTSLPWGVVFGHPADGSLPIARHPIQLYEAGAYLISFCILWTLWKKHYYDKQPGAFVGLLFIFIFGSRFVLEFWKATQESIIDSSFLQMGQILSIPFILLGCYLVWRAHRSYSCCN